MANVTVTSPISPLKVTELTDAMIERRMLRPEEKAAFTKHLQSDPDAVVKLASRFLDFSIPSPAQGRGIGNQETKRSDATVDDGWNVVWEQGA